MPSSRARVLAATVQGFTMAEMKEQCEAFAPAMREYQARLVSQSPDQVTAALQTFVAETGAPPAQMSGNARICLGFGYQDDNAELALAASMVLVGLGETAYAELLGQHLLNGLAVPKRPDRGIEWIDVAVEGLDAGPSPLVAGNADTHLALLRQAVMTVSGDQKGAVLQDAAAPAASGGFVLPMPQAQSN